MLIKTTLNLLKGSKLCFKHVPVMFQSTNYKIVDNCPKFEPSGHIPDSLEYMNIPVVIDGTKVVVKNGDLSLPFPLLPTIDDNDFEFVDGTEESLNKENSLEDELCVWFGETMPTIQDEKSPERDTINFPRLPARLWNPPKTRYFLIPESYFKFFEPKTGVTGGYMFGFTLSTFLLSKEYFILGEDAYNILAFSLVCAIIVKKFAFHNKNLIAAILKENQGWTDWRFGMIDYLKKYIGIQEKNKSDALNQPMLFNAKRENVLFQREIEYRKRNKKIFDEVKRKLDYHVAIQETLQQFKQKHLVDWVIENVNKSLDPNLEKLVLQKCVSDLKNLSIKRKNSI